MRKYEMGVNMTEIKQVKQYSDIMFSFEPKVRYFAEIEAAGGALFCAYEDKEPIGIVCLRKQANIIDTTYLYVSEVHRKKGIAKELMKSAVAFAKKEDKHLHFRVIENNEYANVCMKIVKALDMQKQGEMTFFGLDINTESKKAWEDYKPQVLKTIERIERRAGKQSVISFADASEELLNKIKVKIGKELPMLDPFALPDLNEEFSVIVLFGDEPVAFNAVRTIGKKMIYEISAAQKGATIIAAVPVFFNKLFNSDIERVSCIVYNDNPAGLNHAKGRFGFLFKESNHQTIFSK